MPVVKFKNSKSMNIRPARAEDKSSIIALLRQSLGESMIPKSEELWKWKHEENPFGPSFVLLAEEENEIIGVRAFMQWTWIWKNRKYQAIRAVDTATHPAHQGKGIFKKLTLKQLELCEAEGIDFVFNTPNDQSRPGYLKMGWQQQGKMPLKMYLHAPFKLASQIILKKIPEPVIIPLQQASEWARAADLMKKKSAIVPEGIHTFFNASYLSWRYALNPLFTYHFISDFENYILIYRLKEHSRYTEFRITDFLVFNEQPVFKKHLHQNLNKAADAMKADIISMSGNQFRFYQKYLGSFGMVPVKPLGPIVTVREVNKQTDMPALLNIDNWQYSLGDMELF